MLAGCLEACWLRKGWESPGAEGTIGASESWLCWAPGHTGCEDRARCRCVPWSRCVARLSSSPRPQCATTCTCLHISSTSRGLSSPSFSAVVAPVLLPRRTSLRAQGWSGAQRREQGVGAVLSAPHLRGTTTLPHCVSWTEPCYYETIRIATPVALFQLELRYRSEWKWCQGVSLLCSCS